MVPVKRNYTGTGAQEWIPVDYLQSPFKLSVAAQIVSGAVTYTVEHTFDNILAGETPRAYQNAGMTGLTASADGNYDFPVTAVRLNIAANTGSVDFMVLQGRN